MALHAGKVVSYEIRKDFVRIIKHNAELLGLSNVTVKNQDAYLELEEEGVDVLTVDLLEPWLVPTDCLRVGGYLVAYCPTINQVEKVKRVEGFVVEEVCELIKRDWREDKILRPKSKMIAHTGFLVFMRKL
jgi:tRNA (adenine57-N1/adenine58-N1)-methyltransferase